MKRDPKLAVHLLFDSITNGLDDIEHIYIIHATHNVRVALSNCCTTYKVNNHTNPHTPT